MATLNSNGSTIISRVRSSSLSSSSPSSSDAGRALKIALALLTLAGVVICCVFAGLAYNATKDLTSDSSTTPETTALPKPSCAPGFNIVPKSLVKDAMRFAEGGFFQPTDTHMAVGNNANGGRIMTVVNSAVAIFHKNTMERLFFQSIYDFFQFDPLTIDFNEITAGGFLTEVPGDPTVHWDESSSAMWTGVMRLKEARHARTLVIDDMPEVTFNAIGGAWHDWSSFDAVSGPVVMIPPFIPCTGEIPAEFVQYIVGTIVLAQRGDCGPLAQRARQAQLAGAVGFIGYNRSGDNDITGMSKLADFALTIPAVFVGYGLGAYLRDEVAFSSRTVTIAQSVAPRQSDLRVAISTRAHPDKTTEFSRHVLSAPSWADTHTDFPKFYVGDAVEDVLTVTARSSPASSGVNGFIVSQFNKTALLNGGTVQLLSDVLIPYYGDYTIFPTPVAPQPRAHMPSKFFAIRPQPQQFGEVVLDLLSPPTLILYVPLTRLFITWFEPGVEHNMNRYVSVSLPADAGLRVYRIFTVDAQFNPIAERQPLMRQPLAFMGVPGLDVPIIDFMDECVQKDNSLFCTFTYNPSAIRTAVAWVEIDISAFVSNGTMRLAQFGTLEVGDGVDASWSSVNVDRDGNMAIMATISGPTTYPSVVYTGRAFNDPLGTLRYPLQTAFAGKSVYMQGAYQPGDRPRWADYQVLRVDPAGKKRFYGFAQVPAEVGEFNMAVEPYFTYGTCDQAAAMGTCVARYWSTVMFSFEINYESCPGRQTFSAPLALASAAVANMTMLENLTPVPTYTGPAVPEEYLFSGDDDEDEDGEHVAGGDGDDDDAVPAEDDEEETSAFLAIYGDELAELVQQQLRRK
jgi:hypothetical protein